MIDAEHREIRKRFEKNFQDALSCLTINPFVSSRTLTEDSAGPYSIFFQDNPQRLPESTAQQTIDNPPKFLRIIHIYEVLENKDQNADIHWKTRTKEYYYTIIDADRQSIFAYHCHGVTEVVGRSAAHLHLYNPAARIGRSDIPKAHFPTGRISFERLILILFTEFNTPCVHSNYGPGCKDCRDWLVQRHLEFERQASWIGSAPGNT